MKRTLIKGGTLAALALSTALAVPTGGAEAAIPGVSGTPGADGTVFNLTAKANFISTPDGGVHYMWLWRDDDLGNTFPQYPGPTLIVNQGDAVTVNVSNNLQNQAAAMPVSFTSPGLNVYCESGCTPEGAVVAGGSATYKFTASRPGTFHYYSDHRTDIGVGMGLVGAIIVRPNNFVHGDNPNARAPGRQRAYGSGQTRYDHEYLVLTTDLDIDFHTTIRGEGEQDWEFCRNLVPNPDEVTDYCADHAEKLVALTEALRDIKFFPEHWFINGRAAFDNFQGNNLPWLPTQPYNGISQIHPGQKALVRYVGAGRQIHPFHPHGDEVAILAVDAQGAHVSGNNGVGGSPGGAFPNLQWREYTVDQMPGQTVDTLWDWLPVGLGFDIYGNDASAYAGVSCRAGEPADVFVPFRDDPLCIVDEGDRGVAIPTSQPALSDLIFGGFWSGSPFLGQFGTLPPGEGGLNANGGLSFIWHSHREKELLANDVFPSGMLSSMFVEPYEGPDGTVTIPRGSCFDSNNGIGC